MANGNYTLTIENKTADENENNPIAGDTAGSKQARGGEKTTVAANTVKTAQIMAVAGAPMHFSA